MKSKIKRGSRSALSIVLAVCMLISCMTVGLIATDAAQADSNSAVGVELNDVSKPEDDSVGASVNQDDTNSAEVSFDYNDSDDIGLDADDAVGAISDESVGVTGDVVINGSAGGKTMYQKDGNYFYPTGQISSYSWKFRYNNKDYGSTSDNDSYRDIYSTDSSKSVGVNRSSDFRWKGSSGKYTIWVNGDLTSTWVTSGTESIPTKNLTVS